MFFEDKNDKHEKQFDSFEDVAGWKSIIFLPFNSSWRVIILLSILVSFLAVTTQLAYLPRQETVEFYYAIYVCDTLFLVDVICLFMHYALHNTRKLRIYKRMPLACLLIDVLSLIPIELIDMAVYRHNAATDNREYNFEEMNRVLRLYRVYMYFEYGQMERIGGQNNFFYTYLELTTYALIIFHTTSCVYHFSRNDDDLQFCPEINIRCVITFELEVFIAMYQRFTWSGLFYSTIYKRVICCILLTVGYFFINTYMLPKVIYSCFKRLRPFFDLWNRFERLRIFLGNVTEDPNLKRKILDEFRLVWKYGKGDVEPEILKVFPLSMRKNLYSDMFWDAFRHSEIFRNVSVSFKRSLALKMSANFYMPGTVFWDKDEERHCMLYLSSGILQIMAEENSESPIMSLSGGTVLGETSLFFGHQSKTILRVATFSEVHRLHSKDFFRVINSYPADKVKIFRTVNFRMKLARMTQIRKNEIFRNIFSSYKSLFGEMQTRDDSVKWIKNEFRSIMKASEAMASKGKPEGLLEINASMDHTSVFLPLLNLAEDVEVHLDLTCLKTSLPWVIEPNSSFIRLWSRLILVLVSFSIMVYPLFIGWWPETPPWLFNVSAGITFIYIVDLFVQVSTAVKKKDIILVNFGRMFLHKIKGLSFYADLISAVPLQIIFRYIVRGSKTQERLSISISLLKIYRIASFMNEWCYTLKGSISPRIMIKFFFFHSLIIYWAAALIQICDVDCLLYTCPEDNWYLINRGRYPNLDDLGSISLALNFLMNTPYTESLHMTEPSVYILMVCLLVEHYVLMSWYGDFNSAYILERSHLVKLEILQNSLAEFMHGSRIHGRIKRRIKETLNFQRRYDQGDLLIQEKPMLDDASEKLSMEIRMETTYKVVEKCALFESEDADMLKAVCTVGRRIAVPANYILVTFGNQTMNLYIVYKGYLTINSFMLRDTKDGLSPSTVSGPGTIIPVIITMNQMPSSVTVRTLTDCELIVLNLETFLTTLILHESFNYFVESIKDVNMKPFETARLTLASVPRSTQAGKRFALPSAKLKSVVVILSYVLLRQTIHCESSKLLKWEFFRMTSYVVAAVFWPIASSLIRHESRIYIIYLLFGLESITWVDFYIRMHVSYYDKRGIEITQRLLTVKHYLFSGFLLDFLMFIPYLHSMSILAFEDEFSIGFMTLLPHSLLRLISLKHLIRYFLYVEDKHDELQKVRYVKYIIVFLVCLNALVVLKIADELVTVTNPDGSTTQKFTDDSWLKGMNLPHKDNAAIMYILMLYCMIMLIFQAYPFERVLSLSSLAWEVTLPSAGLIITMYIHSSLSSMKMGSSKNAVIYQYHLKSLAYFLKSQKADDNLSLSAISHFEHEWERIGGKRFQNTLSGLSEVLQEDLLFPIYKKTFYGVYSFRGANMAFFRILSRTVSEVYMKKGSTILFQNEVTKLIYFVHKGVCFVQNPHTVLYRGSIIGDIQGKGFMKSHIVALTHVVLLSINSKDFFLALNNFYYTERAFFAATRNIDDFMPSVYIFNMRSIGKDIEEDPWVKAVRSLTECEFEMIGEHQVASKHKQKDLQVNHKTFIINFLSRKLNPQSRLCWVLDLIFGIDILLTSFLIPIIVGLRLRMAWVFVVVYTLDLIWVFKMIVTIRTMYIDRDTGHLISKTRLIMKNYVKRVDGFIPDLLSIIPFEILQIILEKFIKGWRTSLFKYCFCLRLLRVLCRWYAERDYLKKVSRGGDMKKWILIFLRQLIWIHLLTAINLLISDAPLLTVDDNQREFSMQLIEAFSWNYLSLINIYTGLGINIFRPKTLKTVIFYICLVVIATMQRTFISNEVLFILSVKHHMKSEKLNKIKLMENYISIRDVSDTLRRRAVSYATVLSESHKTEVTPFFLSQCPHYIRTKIMEDLYLSHLSQCYAFQNLPQDFLMQLAERLRREMFLPNEVIVQKGDVDANMYFVHEGEVVLLESDEIYPDLDYELDVFTTHDHFGVVQGLHIGLPHYSTFRARTKADVLHLNFFEWADLRAAFLGVAELIQGRAANMVKTHWERRNTQDQ